MVLVAGQIAVSVTLLAGAGLLLRSFWNVLQVDPGFDSTRVLVGSIWLPPPSKPDAPAPYRTPASRTLFARDVLRRVRALPGVESAALGAGQNIPLVGWNAVSFEVEADPRNTQATFSGQGTAITPGFFRALGVPFHAGRDFAESDERGAAVAIVDETLARRYWPSVDPVGQRVRVAPGGTPQWMRGPAGLEAAASSAVPWHTVIGVVGRIKSASFEAPDVPHLYLPLSQRSHYGMTVFVRTHGDPAMLGPALEREVQAVDADLPVFGVRTLGEVVARSLAQRRFTLVLLGSFALLALLLAGLGVYGIMAEAVSQRRREIAIRVAIGASPPVVAWMIARQAMLITACGLVAGLAGALVLTRSLRSLLFEATPIDPVAYLGTIALLAAVALSAAYAPSRRAARTDPVAALRCE
jgi:predicted permease